MSYTFDTAWIIAQMIRTRSEATKALIRRRIENLQTSRYQLLGHEAFETFCWAWREDALAESCSLPSPSHNPYPFKDRGR